MYTSALFVKASLSCSSLLRKLNLKNMASEAPTSVTLESPGLFFWKWNPKGNLLDFLLKILMSGLYPKPIKLEWLNTGLAECGADSLFLKNIPLGFLRCSQGWGQCCKVTLGLPWTEAMKSGELRALLTKLGPVRWCQRLSGGCSRGLMDSQCSLCSRPHSFLKSSVKVASLKTNTWSPEGFSLNRLLGAVQHMCFVTSLRRFVLYIYISPGNSGGRDSGGGRARGKASPFLSEESKLSLCFQIMQLVISFWMCVSCKSFWKLNWRYNIVNLFLGGGIFMGRAI